MEQRFEEYVSRISAVFSEEYGELSTSLDTLMVEAGDLYFGRWPDHEACQVTYHTLEHALEVALASARMMAGWNRTHYSSERLSADMFLIGVAAALFHDSGYIKDKGDSVGNGGKYTFTHVPRSAEMAHQYLESRGWPRLAVELVPLIIGVTEFHQPVHLPARLQRFPARTVTNIVATADLVAQIADVYYMERLPDLYAEFQEAYQFEGPEALAERGVQVIGSLHEMVDNTPAFFERFIIPRLEKLERADRYLSAFFGGRRNPYLETISANLYAPVIPDDHSWSKIGELLEEMRLVSPGNLERALMRQRRLKHDTVPEFTPRYEYDRLIRWINRHSGRNELGEVLLQMGEIQPADLRMAMGKQLIPDRLLANLDSSRMAALLRIGMLLGSIRSTPRAITQVMELANELLECEAGSIMLAQEPEQALVIVVATGPHGKDVRWRPIPWDKGIAGWVYSHNRAAVVNNTNFDTRFYPSLDAASGYQTESILAVPLVVEGRPVGALEVINKRRGTVAFDERDVSVLSIISRQLAGAIETIMWFLSDQELNRI